MLILLYCLYIFDKNRILTLIFFNTLQIFLLTPYLCIFNKYFINLLCKNAWLFCFFLLLYSHNGTREAGTDSSKLTHSVVHNFCVVVFPIPNKFSLSFFIKYNTNPYFSTAQKFLIYRLLYEKSLNLFFIIIFLIKRWLPTGRSFFLLF